MGRIFEVFGYPLDDQSEEATTNRKATICPFMAAPCDGGGNRHLSSLSTKNDPDLRRFVGGKDVVPAGVCSIQPRESEPPWIVCPRRLLVLGREKGGTRRYQAEVERLTLELLAYSSGTRLGVWPEVKIKKKTVLDGPGEVTKNFDYTFDYVLMPLGDVKLAEIGQDSKKRVNELRDLGWVIDERDGEHWALDAPSGNPTVIEIMTSSTSGGNKAKGTTIPMAFREALLNGVGAPAPGINYRQVWARMVSQLIVKSEAAKSWGGHALWVVQDLLADYISQTTALDLEQLEAGALSDVNMLSFSYGAEFSDGSGVIELPTHRFFAGALPATASGGFLDIIRTASVPPLDALVRALLARPPINKVRAP